MDGVIEPILQRLKAIELHIWGPPADDSGHNLDTNPGQTLALSRMPAQPGLPIAPYDPSVHQDDETDAAMAAEADARANPKPDFIPSDDGDASLDPTLNEDGTTRRRRRKSDDTDTPDAA